MLGACGGDSGGGSAHPDAKSTIDAFASECGQPGDLGNDKGVGKFCEKLSDCSGNQGATLCSILGDTTTHFCTTTCAMGSTDTCGTGATCTCNDSNQCGCTPNACL